MRARAIIDPDRPIFETSRGQPWGSGFGASWAKELVPPEAPRRRAATDLPRPTRDQRYDHRVIGSKEPRPVRIDRTRESVTWPSVQQDGKALGAARSNGINERRNHPSDAQLWEPAHLDWDPRTFRFH